LYFLTALVVAAISPLLNTVEPAGKATEHILAFIWGTAEWSYFPVFPWFAYVLTGYSFRLFQQQILQVKKFDVQNHFVYLIPVWIGLFITLPYASGITHNLDGTGGYYHHGLLFFIWVLLFMISYLILIQLIEISFGNHRSLRLVKWIGQKVTLLYVIQWLIIGNIATWLFRSQDLFQYLAWFVVVTLTTIGTGFLFERIRGKLKNCCE
jgi:hypothetical protein